MRKRRINLAVNVIMLLFVTTLVSGCHKNDGAAEAPTKGAVPPATSMEYELLEKTEGQWKDNTLDELYAVFNLALKPDRKEGGQVGRTSTMVNEGGCILFMNHLWGYGKDWSGVNGITKEGEEFSRRIEVETDVKVNKVGIIGLVSGGEGYVAYRTLYDDDGGICLYNLNKDFQKTEGFQAKLDVNELFDVMGDPNGNFHVVDLSNGKNVYRVFSPEGEEIFHAEGKYMLTFRAFGEGRVAVCDAEYKTNGETRFYEADLESGELRELSVSKIGAEDKKRIRGYGTYATPVDDNRLLCCTGKGVIIYDSAEGKVRTLYQWSNHGILPTGVKCANVAEDGSVGIVYKDGDGLHYVLLKPTEKREEIKSVAFAVTPEHYNAYQSAAAYFNAAYPSYNVTIRDDWDETSLLTQLGAGDGPVIVDTAITGFEELENLWQPLDGFLEQTGLADELIPEALEFGKIGDVTYGIARDFRIGTLVVPESGASDWDYDGFLNALENSGGAAPLCHWYHETPLDFRQEFFEVLSNGLWDSHYLDAKTGRTIFGTPEFERVLRLSESARRCPPAEDGKAIREGTALCEVVGVSGIEDVVKLRRRLEARGETAVGYPTKDGARNLLVAGAPIAIRSTATDEEKKIAYTFLMQVLSRDAYTAMSGGDLPVRRDALEDKFENYKITVSQLSQAGGGAGNDVPEPDDEKDAAFLENLIRGGTVQRSFPAGLQKVFDEEFGDYLAGRIDGRALDEHLKSRVWLYLEESK